MKRKLASLILALAMLATSVCTVFADTNVVVSGTNVQEMIEFFADSTPSDQAKRQEILSYIKAYIGSGDDRDMDTLIDSVKSGVFVEQAMQDIYDRLEATGNDDILNTAIFTLELIRAIPADKRMEVIDGFHRNTRVKYVFADESNADELIDLYNNNDVYPTVLKDKLEDHSEMSPQDTPYIVLNLFTAWTDCFVLTDNAAGTGFKLLETDGEFDERLMRRMGDYKLDGKPITDSAQIFKVLTEAINDSYSTSVKKKMKAVLGDANLALYVPAETKDTTGTSGTRKPSTSSNVNEHEEQIPDTGIPTPPAAEIIFPDTAEHWAKDYISAVAAKGLVKGYDDGTFQPNWGITRQEMAVVLVRLLGIESELGSATVDYKDSASIAEWAADSVALLSAKGIYKGYDDGEFKPTRIITREEIVALLMRLYGTSDASAVLRYADSETIGEWARLNVAQATTLGIVSGRDDGKFYAKDDVTRAETCKMLYNFINLPR